MSSSNHRVFEYAVAGVIAVNTGLLVWSLIDSAHAEIIEHIETLCLAFFVVELVLRLRSHGWRRFIKSPWCMFDSSVIALSLMPVLGVDVSLLRIARLARLAHLGRHFSHLRLLRLLVVRR